MKVFKFGGASLKTPERIRHVASIVRSHASAELLVVVSAMGKTTDLLETLVDAQRTPQRQADALQSLTSYHYDIIDALFKDTSLVRAAVDALLTEIKDTLASNAEGDLLYDQVVSKGELISSAIVHHYFISEDIKSHWLDARTCIHTDSTFREGKVDWTRTEASVQPLVPILKEHIIVTQGFIGRTSEGLTTTLGREGSDYTAAIFTATLGASSLTIWKDVAGVMNADPKRFPSPVVFEELPFKEAAEMTYYGASVIHPKTIKPLANKNIPLLVKNFDDPSLPGTRIHECTVEQLPPLIVFKDNQCLISCKVTDYTFISEEQLGVIFHALSELDIRINLMQNSAISFSFCIDFRESKVIRLIGKLQERFEVYYNTGLTLITIKNYDQASFDTYRKRPGVMLEQSSRSTLQVLVKTTT